MIGTGESYILVSSVEAVSGGPRETWSVWSSWTSTMPLVVEPSKEVSNCSNCLWFMRKFRAGEVP